CLRQCLPERPLRQVRARDARSGRALATYRLQPGDDLTVAVGDERDAAVVRDDDGQAARVLADEAVRGAVARADVLDGVHLAVGAFGIEGPPDARRGGDLARHLG